MIIIYLCKINLNKFYYKMIIFNTFDFNFIYSALLSVQMDIIGNIDITNIIVLTTILVSITSIIMLSTGSGKKVIDAIIKGLQIGAGATVIATGVNTGFGTKLKPSSNNDGKGSSNNDGKGSSNNDGKDSSNKTKSDGGSNNSNESKK